MRKVLLYLFGFLIAIALTYLCYNFKALFYPQDYYVVYLDGNKLGIIKSKEELETHIDAQQQGIKDTYKVTKVEAPTGLKVEKTITYKRNLTTVEKVYNKINETKPFTIKGYQITINYEEGSKQIFVLDINTFETAVNKTIKTFVGTNDFNAYYENTQVEIDATGKYIDNIYVENAITVKDVNIGVNEKIYTLAEELSQYLLFGTTEQQKTYTVKDGDTIETLSFNNKISTEEFLISNPQFTNENTLLFPNQEVVIGILEPQINVIVEEQVVEDLVDNYDIIETIDESVLIGNDTVVREGENGLLRVTKNVQYSNGIATYVDTTSQVELKPTVDKLITKGGKKIPSVGSKTNWAWPTQSGWSITSTYGYRRSPITGQRELHAAIDIAGPGYGSKIFAVTNGVIYYIGYDDVNGNHIIINHNNGYYSLYNHMSKMTDLKVGSIVDRGQVIGYMGMTGYATGPHLHFAVSYGGHPFKEGARIDPRTMYKR